jgi:hypothetical protein
MCSRYGGVCGGRCVAGMVADVLPLCCVYVAGMVVCVVSGVVACV